MASCTIRLGTRGSKLATTQSGGIAEQLRALGCSVEMVIIKTTGDRFPERPVDQFSGKGVFVAEIEQALLRGEVDLAVHSLKDLPGEMTPGLALAATPVREDPRDALIGRAAPTLATLPSGARVGTSSLRRRAQLLALRSDLEMLEMRGNVDTRLRKLDEGQYDAICLAAAGLRRLGLAERITEYFDTKDVLPAAGQGSLALQTREDDAATRAAVAPLHDEATGLAVRAERAVLAALGGGCQLPLGVFATITDGRIRVRAMLSSLDGATIIRGEGDGSSPEDTGLQVARELWDHGQHLFPGHEVPLAK
ncbi:MAG: hydroxymethylbilane synthase [Armatimonadota bacterium]